MKNGLLVWNVVLSLLVAFLVIMHFTSKKSSAGSSKNSAGDTSSLNKPFSIAYFEMDSVAANFEMVKEFKTELSAKEDVMNTEISNRTKALQQKYNYYQGLAQAGTLSQSQSEAASKEMKDMDDEMKSRKQQLDQEYNDYMARKQNEIKSEIEKFIKEYNKTKQFSYVISDDPGLLYFQDPAYNITSDVIKGLNETYKAKKK